PSATPEATQRSILLATCRPASSGRQVCDRDRNHATLVLLSLAPGRGAVRPERGQFADVVEGPGRLHRAWASSAKPFTASASAASCHTFGWALRCGST